MGKHLAFALTALLLVAGLTAGITTPASAAPAAPVSAAGPADDERQLLRLLNEVRQANGRPGLQLDGLLSHDARRWSTEMAGLWTLFHTPRDRMINEIRNVVPNLVRWGENLAYGTSVLQIHNALWNSPGHRANMLGDYTHVGIGVTYHLGRNWYTFRFAKGTPAMGPTLGFPDVPASAFYAKPVVWLVDRNVTTGVGNTGLFRPDQAVTRGEMATFLWRLAGQPSASAPRFADVPSSAYYAKAVTWMRSRGITTGAGGTNSFRPNDVVTRQQMAAFLHRFAGEKVITQAHGFRDVRGGYAETPVRWLAFYGITTGTAPGIYSPHAIVTRGQMATFIQRLAQRPRAFTTSGAKVAV